MSIVGYKSQNHPQQTGKRGAKDAVDDRGTDPAEFAKIADEFGPFTLDVAAAAHNTKCARYFTVNDNGLDQSWSGERVWCNPPYSDIAAWVIKAWTEYEETRGITMLLPANRCEQRWWQDHVEPYRDRGGPLSVRFLPGRMRFIRPDWTPGPKGDRPPFGCCLLVWSVS